MIIFFKQAWPRETKPNRRETKHVRTINVNTTTLKASKTAPKLNNTAAEKLNRTSMLMMTDDGAEDGDS